MLLDKKAGTVAFERANTIRSVEYMRNMIADGPIHDRITTIYEQSVGFNESAEADEDRDILRHFHANGDEDADTEIKRILESTDDLTFDEMIGLEYVDDDPDIIRINKEISAVKKKIKNAKKIVKTGDTKNAILILKDAKHDLRKIDQELSKIDPSKMNSMNGKITGLIEIIGMTCFGILSIVLASQAAAVRDQLLYSIAHSSVVGSWLSVFITLNRTPESIKDRKIDVGRIIKDLEQVCDNTIKSLENNS